jgi:glycosyltransferase involved in cell wall biosynthesis
LNLQTEISNKKIIVVIPVYNEGPVLENVLRSFVKKQIAMIIVVDDGSLQPIRSTISDLPLVIIRHKVNLGQGAALQTGFNYAKNTGADVVVTFDADGQHEVGDLPSLILPILNNEADIVLGSRFLFKTRKGIPFTKQLVLLIARLINFLFTGLLLSDAHNGLRAFSRKAIEKIKITENRMAHASEILFEIKKHKLQFKEIPVKVHYSAYAQKKGQRNLDSIKILFDLVLHKLFK